MAAEASIISRYILADFEERVCIMLENYTTFEAQLEIELDGIEYRIKEERAYQRRIARGELGVRIQSSGISDPTFREAEENIMIAEALEKMDLNSDIFDSCEEVEAIKRDIYAMEIMQIDFRNMKKQLKVMKSLDRSTLLTVYDEEVEIQTLAVNEGIDYESARSRVNRAKKRLQEKMIVFWNQNQRRGL